MTKFRKLSTLFLSTLVASVMASQVALGEKSAKDYFNQAQTHLQQKEFKQALEDLNRAIQIDPNYPEAYLSRATIYANKGDREKTVENLEKAATLFKQQGQTEQYELTQQLLQNPSYLEKTPLPSSKSNYIGIWESDPFIDSIHGGKDNHYVFLGIKKDSTIVYANNKPDLCFHFYNVITEIVNDSEIKTLVELIKTLTELPDWFPAGGNLKVNESPHQVAGQWRMTIEGNELYRTKPKMEQKFRFKCSGSDLRQVSP